MQAALMRVARWRPGRLDGAVAVGLVVYGQVELLYIGGTGPVAAALSLAMTGALLWRRAAPVPVGLFVAAVYGLQALVLNPAPQVLANAIAVLVTIYTAAAFAGPKASVPVLGLTIVSFAGIESDAGTLPNLSGDVVIAAASWGVGWFVWRRRHQIDRDLAEAEAEVRSADARAEQALTDERRRIARELHDVVSHAVTVVVLQARGGRSMLDRDPEQTREALDAIEQSGQQALAEMRRLVTLLREPNPDTAPQPALRDLDALVNRARASGADVTLSTCGTPGTLGPGAELTAYRLVQEALTNALRHAQNGLS